MNNMDLKWREQEEKWKRREEKQVNSVIATFIMIVFFSLILITTALIMNSCGPEAGPFSVVGQIEKQRLMNAGHLDHVARTQLHEVRGLWRSSKPHICGELNYGY